jgi:4-hydroxythreonine-4-phosphate dehydrogenase
MPKDFVQLVISSGEPAGIGPQISIHAAEQFIEKYKDVQITVLGDEQLLKNYANFNHQQLLIEHISLKDINTPGKLNPQNAQYVLQLLDLAYWGCQQKKYDALVTAPIQKSVINDFGIHFTGHTEYFAELAKVDKVVMMLCGMVHNYSTNQHQMMRVALASTHLALKDVATTIDQAGLVHTLQIIHESLGQHFGLRHPQIYVAGLNPHAGENGYLGKEEQEYIIPAIEQASKMGIAVYGPYPADTMFRYSSIEKADIFLAMYHDQGLIPLKMATFGQGVNVTLGLPIIRTSVDHGTALDMVNSEAVSSTSMYQAIEVAYQMVKNGSSGA